jgi:hypothetical protein
VRIHFYVDNERLNARTYTNEISRFNPDRPIVLASLLPLQENYHIGTSLLAKKRRLRREQNIANLKKQRPILPEEP